MSWQFIAEEDIGGRAEQQDRLTVLHHGTEDVHLAVVADGVGGHGNGALAAQTVIDVVTRQFPDAELCDPESFLEQLCQDAHRAILDLETTAEGISGSTCVFLLVRGREAYWAHVGDSRLYLLREKNMRQLTVDHSLVQLQADAGIEAGDGSQPEISANQLYMCLGSSNKIVPETSACSVTVNDLFLLCSDGLWGQVDIDEVAASLSGSVFDPQLGEHWVQRAKQAGESSGDNISMVLVRRTETPRRGIAALLRSLLSWFTR